MKIDAKTPPDTSLESEIELLKKQLFLSALRIEQLDSSNQHLQAINQGLATSNQQLTTSNQQLTTSNQQLEIHTTYLQALVDKLQFEVARHKRWLFGSKTEQMNPQQFALFEETRLEDLTAIEQLQQQIDSLQRTYSATPKPTRKPIRQVLPAHLERVDVIHLPKVAGVEDVSASGDWLKISEEVKEELDIVPAKFFVKRHLYPKYKQQATGEIICALRPASIINGGYASNGLLAWVVSSKYLDHLPLNRIEQIALRDQVILPKSTLCEWVGHVGCALTPLTLALKEQLVKHRVLHADETPVKQLSPKTPNKHHQSYLWVYRTADLTSDHSKIILFDYQASRAGSHPQQLLKDFSGHLMVDDYAGYKALFKRPMNPLIELGCWAHARRKFYELTTGEQTHPAAANIVLDIAKLYAIESRTKDMNSEQRQAIRKQEAIPILTALKITLDTHMRELAPKSLMAKAVQYSLKRWDALIAYAQTGHLPIDNNPAENAVRPIALGRKNWLFVGSEAAGQRQAVILSLLATAKANGLDPAKWLLDTLEKLPTTKNKDLHTLLPFKNWHAV